MKCLLITYPTICFRHKILDILDLRSVFHFQNKMIACNKNKIYFTKYKCCFNFHLLTYENANDAIFTTIRNVQIEIELLFILTVNFTNSLDYCGGL